MKIDFYRTDSWFEINEALEKQFHLEDTGAGVQVFKGVMPALLEITSALVRLFPHRKKIFYLKDANPFVEMCMRPLAREGLTVEGLTIEQLKNPTAQPFNKETLFVLTCADDPLLGQSFEFPGLRQILEASRIFLIELSHSAHLVTRENSQTGIFQAEVLSVETDLAIALLGERVKIVAPYAEGVCWDMNLCQKIVENTKPRRELQQVIETFESKSIGHSCAPLKHQPRIWDRAVVTWETVDGHAVIDELSRRLGFELLPPGTETRLETASLSRWGGLRTMDWLKGLHLTPHQIRGLTIIDAELLNDNFEVILAESIDRILKLQSGL